MSTIKRARRTAEQMSALIDQWKHSGQRKQEFCANSGIALCVFEYWRRKQDLLQVGVDPGRGFAEVKAPERSLPSGGVCSIRLHYPDGRVLEFVESPSVLYLREVLAW